MTPKQPVLKSALYEDETSSFTDLNILMKQFQAKKIRPTRTSPPILADIKQNQLYIDETARRLYTNINGALRYIAFT